jgi:hypothetical protein
MTFKPSLLLSLITCLFYPLSKFSKFLPNNPQVLSPLQAILDYELSQNIPPGWVNNCISKTKPNGFWHRLERGEILMDSAWFRGFTSDLHNPSLWADFYTRARTTNPSLPSATPPLPTIDGEALFWKMMGGSRKPVGDPILHLPTYPNYNLSRGAPLLKNPPVSHVPLL